MLITGFVTLMLIAVGAIFFVLPALYPLARFFAVRQAVVLEHADAGGALVRSSELSLGAKRHILNTLLLVLVVTIAFSLGTALISSRIPSKVVYNVLATAVYVVVYPFFGITQTLLYYDIRIRKEGFDIEYMARSTGAATAGQSDMPT